MPDNAHIKTDKILARMERRLSGIYSGVADSIEKKATAYFKAFAEADAKKRQMVADGLLKPGDYARWRRGKILYGRRFKALADGIAADLEHVNETAMRYINGKLPEVYALNYNALERQVDGVGGYSFEMTDANTVKRLATTNKSLLPKKRLDPKKDKAWNMRNVHNSVLHSILLGESIPDMAKRLRHVEVMNKDQSVRAARTLVTAVENKGRQDGFEKVVSDGVILEKFWIRTHDARTREEHVEAGRQYNESRSIPIDQPFIVGGEKMMHPGDTSLGASGHNIYNCRCTMGTVVKGFKKNER